jgi:hypothetical protein
VSVSLPILFGGVRAQAFPSPFFREHITDSAIHVSAGSREYLPELARARAAREKSLQDVKEASLSQFMGDLAVDRAKNPGAAENDRWEPEDENEDEDEDLEADIIDQSERFDRIFRTVRQD